jgi:hypothetical protein
MAFVRQGEKDPGTRKRAAVRGGQKGRDDDEIHDVGSVGNTRLGEDGDKATLFK